MDYYELGQRIRKARKQKLLSQEQLAEKVGISVTHMSHIETGNTKLSMEVFYDIALVLDTRADELLYGRDNDIQNAVKDDIIVSLSTCTPEELCIINDVIAALKQSLQMHKPD